MLVTKIMYDKLLAINSISFYTLHNTDCS